MAARISSEVRGLERELVGVRRDIHAHPELGFREKRTSKLIETKLRSWGVGVKRVCGTGIIGTIQGSEPGRTILIRADMDALPLKEENRVPYRSRIDGVMHACGHDAHVAMALGAARVLAGRRDQLKGTVKFMFQPAEEGPGGAVPMIEAGVLEKPEVEQAFAIHVWNEIDAGKVGVRAGPVFAGAGTFTATIEGRGGHGAAPHETIDPVVLAAQFITQVQTVVSRRIAPIRPAVVTVGRVEGGTRHNIIPDRVTLQGTYRFFDRPTLRRIKQGIEGCLRGVTAAAGAKFRLQYDMDEYPPTCNDARAAETVREVAGGIVGGRNVVEQDLTMGAEDMGFVLDRVPGCYIVVGSRNRRKGIDQPHHSARFDIDESALPVGTELWVRLARHLLS